MQLQSHIPLSVLALPRSFQDDRGLSHFSAGASPLLPFPLFPRVSLPRPSRALVRLCIHAPTHTPGVGAAGLTEGAHIAIDEVHEPRVGRNVRDRRR